MKPRRSRALLGTTLVTALAAVGFGAGPAHANTTLPGINGKIAFTTNADTIFSFDFAPSQRGQSCYPPFPSMLIGDLLWCGAEINTINPDGSGQAAVTNDFFPDDAAAWSSQAGSRIAFQSSRGETCNAESNPIDCNYDIWTTAADGTDPKQVTSGPLNEMHPSYSPDESTIAFDGLNPILASTLPTDAPTKDLVDPILQQFDHLGQAIYTVPANGGTPAVLEPQSEIDPSQNGGYFVSDSQPAWSPDGSQIAFTRLSIGPMSNQSASTKLSEVPVVTVSSGIYVAPASGGPAHEVGTPQSCDTSGGSVPIVIGAATSGAVRRTTTTTRGSLQTCALDAAPAWSPDGSKLAFERISLLTEQPVSPASRQLVVNEIEDSDILVMNASDGSGEVNLSKLTEPADCLNATLNEDFACGWDQKPAWSPDGTKIAFFSDRNQPDGSYSWSACDASDSACVDHIWTMNADGTGATQVTNGTVNDINPDWQRIPPPPPAPPVQPVTPPAKPAVAPKVGVAGVRRACVAHSFHLRFRIATTASSVKSVVVKLDGKKIKSTKRSRFTLTINARKLKAGRHRLVITARDTNGKVKTIRRTFSVCKAAKPRRHAAPRFTG